MKEICLQIDYRNQSIDWWDWTLEDKEETVYNRFTGERALYTTYKIPNTLFDIYHVLLADMWAHECVKVNIKDRYRQLSYGDDFTILLNEMMILRRSVWDKNDYKVYKQNSETGELELL